MGKIKVVEFLGLPNAGKTTLISRLVRALNDQGVEVRFIQDQIRDAPVRDEIERNRWAVREVGNQIAEAREQDWDLILVERGGLALFASLKVHLNEAKRKKDKQKARRGLRLASDIAREEDFFVLMKVSPEVAEERDQQFPAPSGKIVNSLFLKKLEKSYECVIERVPAHRLITIDGQDEFSKNHDRVLNRLLRLIENSSTLANHG